jgi:hypothetical protein
MAPTDEPRNHGLHYILPNDERLFFGQMRTPTADQLRSLSPLARAVMRDHLETAIRLLDAVHGTIHVPQPINSIKRVAS